jgi:hypothetical protein
LERKYERSVIAYRLWFYLLRKHDFRAVAKNGPFFVTPLAPLFLLSGVRGDTQTHSHTHSCIDIQKAR